MDMIYWDHYYNTVLIVNLLIVIGLFTSLRLFSGVIAHIDPSDELLRKDNPAFGISLAATTLAITILLSGTIYGGEGDDMARIFITVALFGGMGIALMAVTRVIFGKLVLTKISLRDEIVRGNMAVAFADAGNVLAAAIIIRALMVWITIDSMEGFLILLGGYAVSQVLLTGMTLARMKLFGAINRGGSIQHQLKDGNVAMALVFSGRKIGTALAIATAAQIVVYEEYDLFPILFAWFLASVIFIAIWKVLTIAAERIILWRVDMNSEILDQRNIALGALRAVISISMGVLLMSM